MASIINRKQTGRIISLHAELKYLKARYGSNAFELKGLKYDESEKFNPLQFFDLVKIHPSLGIKYDPYLENPLSKAKFHLTQSIQYDTQKSKSVSECLNALEALGWVNKHGNTSTLSETGLVIADLPYKNKEFYHLARKSVLGYGIFVGFLYKCKQKMDKNNVVIRDDIVIGYTNTHELVKEDNVSIPLSMGSQLDTIVRTRSTLFAWAITTGFSLPFGFPIPKNQELWHVETLSEIAKKLWTWSKFKMFIPGDLFDGSFEVSRPLSYKQMTKSTRALRERGQSLVRLASMKAEEKVKNRRFAIVYALADASSKGKIINFDNFLDKLLQYPNLFIVDAKEFKTVMNKEKDIAIISGIPFSENNGVIKPLTKIKTSILAEDAPDNLLTTLNKILSEL